MIKVLRYTTVTLILGVAVRAAGYIAIRGLALFAKAMWRLNVALDQRLGL